MKIKDVLQKTTQFFRDKGIESARLDTELLMSAALQWERMKLYLNYDYPLNEAELSACRELVRRRAHGEPVAYILGRREFYKHSFHVSPAVLIPRPETEILVEEVVQWIQRRQLQAPRILDLGTGSGCIGLSLMKEFTEGFLVAVDRSEQALQVARQNAQALDVESRVRFVAGDAGEFAITIELRDWLGGVFDVIASNPPYIASDDSRVQEAVRKFEPNMALFADDGGLAAVKKWSERCVTCLRPGGFAIFEIGDQHGEAALEIFSALGIFEDIRIVKDLSSRDRFVCATKKETIN